MSPTNFVLCATPISKSIEYTLSFIDGFIVELHIYFTLYTHTYIKPNMSIYNL